MSGKSRGLDHWAQEMFTAKYQMTFMNSSISYTVQTMGIILKGCFSLKKKKERKKENTDTAETNFNIFAKE